MGLSITRTIIDAYNGQIIAMRRFAACPMLEQDS
jgi:signal transduction histidine kinase